ncbi:transglutaminase-like cysteine peptidase [Kordiimonas sp. SCSIO 12603]|uniref:transglutaminase-like cysteine peptidase n=1 Tax=Kordiimonas sp. SCSIO 12603 TaxID=2829596 RepID=UPI0021081B5C|nr:transglutaminase-like cysteine peptidase [Kordiimonas sp. SCSIO 12603]UTW58662.1 transglutaminase-like cysteine peptidase [Kordiimonas sp. SCSIO 12603]
MFRIIGLISIAFGFLVMEPVVSSADAQPRAGLFGSREIRSKSMKSFDKWTDLWRRHNLSLTEEMPEQESTVEQNCRGRDRLRCGKAAWEEFIASQEGAEPLEMIKAVNQYMNRYPYIVDPVNWGLPDYWATPDEFFLKDGDCEDYAISKYVTLKRLGVAPESMRLVILQDQNLRVAHAILAIDYEGEYLVLDNQVDAVLPDSKILHYRPVYSINETAWWLHQVKKFGR